MHDVAIVGAGPSGAWTAYQLARRGARVVIVDGSHPREKPCGGGITGRALALVEHALPQPLPAVSIRRARFLGGTRLYTAAYEAGLVPSPLEPADLNPLPHPFP